MSVYILTFGEYSDRSIKGVFSTEQAALDAAMEHAARADGYCCDIYVATMNETLSPDDYSVKTLRSGTVNHSDEWGWGTEPDPGVTIDWEE